MGRDVFKATESTIGEDGIEWITIIKEGVSQNNRNYRKEALQRAVESGIYDGARMFVDHNDGPPLKRSVKELVSGIETTKFEDGSNWPDGKARVRGQVTWFDDEFKEFSHRASKHLGVSHDSLLKGKRSMKNGRRFEDIEEIKKNHSVDWVVYPSAGGGFEFGVKEGVEMTEAIDWDAIDEEMLKTHKPELYKALTAARSKESEDDDEEEEEEEEEGQESVKVSKKLMRGFENQIQSMVERAFESAGAKQKQRVDNDKKVRDLVNRSTLPGVTKERLITQFSGSESFEEARVTEAIEDAKREVAAIAGPRIRNMGPSGAEAGSSKSVVVGRAHESVAAVFGYDPLASQTEEAKN